MLGCKIIPVKIFVNSAINVVITSNYPYKFLNWVVEVQLDLVGKTAEGFFALELKLFDEVFVLSLSESSSFIGIKEYVVNVKTGVSKSYSCTVIKTAVKFGVCSEFDLEFYFVIVYTLSFDIFIGTRLYLKPQ